MLNAPTRRAVLRRQRQRDLSLWTPFLACAASGLTQTAPEGLVPLDSLSRLRGERSYADSARGTCPSGLPFSPARRAVLRRQRQRDSSLWTPLLACGRDEGWICSPIGAASSRQKDGGTKRQLRQRFLHTSTIYDKRLHLLLPYCDAPTTIYFSQFLMRKSAPAGPHHQFSPE